eukprot:CAMPEP_0194510250 /NCGR_PEP_ID=MMETSP0253-20130528/41508_1 /TAXON_ID=2966 /ORGANISM="Noctiluca scintillans" /LENGTH=104 /DNA_ID=CAMNT_0039353473 /DNA_START=1167 /DNA_END=1481 /DNA_ORIENTATION=-
MEENSLHQGVFQVLLSEETDKQLLFIDATLDVLLRTPLALLHRRAVAAAKAKALRKILHLLFHTAPHRTLVAGSLTLACVVPSSIVCPHTVPHHRRLLTHRVNV